MGFGLQPSAIMQIMYLRFMDWICGSERVKRKTIRNGQHENAFVIAQRPRGVPHSQEPPPS
jgi:hypothetical protein